MKRCCLALLLLPLLALCLVGCANDGDFQNASSRPWNAPKSWETGLPSSISEGR